jgi:transposase-like protein
VRSSARMLWVSINLNGVRTHVPYSPWVGRGKRRIQDIGKADLVRLYCDDALPLSEVARRLGWSPSAIYARLLALGISRRAAWARNAVETDAAELRRLYLEEGLSMNALADRFGCSLTTIWRRLKAAGVESRPDGSTPRFARTDFSGDIAEKAYLVGFRLGDLNIELEGNTIVVKCTSTRSEQVVLFRQLFEPYGHVYTDEATLTRRLRQSIGMSARLNTTFDFLLPKQDAVPEWVLANDETFFAFFAGYVDAEGYFRAYITHNQRSPLARLEIRSYDAVLLAQLGAGLCARGIACPPARLRVLAGYTNRAGVRSNRDLWGLGIHRKKSLRQLFTKIQPYLKHARRRRDMLTALATC